MRLTSFCLSFAAPLFFTSPALGYHFEKSVPQRVARAIVSDLEFVEGIQSATAATSMHQRVFGNVSGADYLEWFNARVDGIGYALAVGEDRGATAYNDSDGGTRNHIVVTNWFAKPDLPQIARVAILFHEARHSEKSYDYWPHRKCPKPYIGEDGREVKSTMTGLPLAGEYACDSTPYGAYGVSVIMLKNIARACRTCNEKVLNDAAFYAIDQLKRMTRKTDRQRIIKDAR